MRIKISKTKFNNIYRDLSDVRVLMLLGFGVIAILVSWSGIKAIQANYSLQKQIATLEQENQLHQLENKNLDLKNQYLNTDEFLELSARRQFGLAAPGERVYLIPNKVALAHTVDLAQVVSTSGVVVAKDQPVYRQNLQAWVNFFLHRQAE